MFRGDAVSKTLFHNMWNSATYVYFLYNQVLEPLYYLRCINFKTDTDTISGIIICMKEFVNITIKKFLNNTVIFLFSI